MNSRDRKKRKFWVTVVYVSKQRLRNDRRRYAENRFDICGFPEFIFWLREIQLLIEYSKATSVTLRTGRAWNKGNKPEVYLHFTNLHQWRMATLTRSHGAKFIPGLLLTTIMHPFGGTPKCPRCQKAVYLAEQVQYSFRIVIGSVLTSSYPGSGYWAWQKGM